MKIYLLPIVALMACTPNGPQPNTPALPASQSGAGAFNITADGATVGIVRGAHLAKVNALRAQNGLAPLTPDSKLESAAMRHARDMTTNKFMDHYGSDGSSPIDRVRGAGYCYKRLYENVSIGYRNAGRAVDAWFTSPKHRANILKADATEIGIAGQDGGGWAMVLARPC